MTRRLVLLIGGFVVLVVALGYAGLVQSFAAGQIQGLALARQNDMARFASLAARSFATDDWRAVEQELTAYHQVYGVHVSVLDDELRVRASSRDSPRELAPAGRAVALRAIQGVDAEPVSPVYPWTSGTFVAAASIGTDSQTIGAVVTNSPLDTVRADVGTRMLLLGGVSLLVVAVTLALLSLPLAYWVLRPVHALERHAARVASGTLDEPVPVDHVVPEIRSLASSFDAMLSSIRRLLLLQQQFADDAAHQLRNPLTALQLNLETLVTTTSDTSASDRRARAALAEVSRLAAIADGLLDLSRAAVRTETSRPIDVSLVLGRGVERWRAALPTISSNIAPDLRVRGVPGEMDQVLDILLDNAAKYAPGARVHVDASWTTDPREQQDRSRSHGPSGVSLVVSDSGAALGPQDATSLGNRFWRGPGTQNLPGAGLGLAIARRLVDGAGGCIEWSVTSHGFVVSTWWPGSTLGAVSSVEAGAGEPRSTTP